MKVPVSWLKEYVDFEASIQELADKLTFCGIEVEGIETIGGAFPGVVVGEVRSVEKHPQADRLSVCRVFDGQAEVQVVCGASNVRAGGKYPLAPVGCTLPGNFTIKKAKLRGVESHGMLCAEDELGLSKNHEGLMVLPESARAGAALAEVLGPPDTVLDLEITPNRPDCLSIMGVAREVAAMTGGALKRPAVELAETGEPVQGMADVRLDDPERCPRYTARVLTGLRLAPSPEWMQRRLTLAGIRPINNIVDITNYVMLESGQPLHAFDYTLIRGQKIVVRGAKEGEILHTLDGQERALSPDMLVIADVERAVAVAGVMGGAGSEIREDTTSVLLESAFFKPSSIRRTAKQLALHTESSHRFARGADIEGAEWASRRAAALLIEHAGATLAQGVIDRYPSPPSPRTIACQWETFGRLVGTPSPQDEIMGILRALELKVEQPSEKGAVIGIPSFRGDLRQEIDLVEEFARIRGLDRIPAPSPCARLVDGATDERPRAIQGLRAQLTGLGLQEIMNYSLVAPSLLRRFDPSGEAAWIVLPHPLSEEQSVLRASLVPQMVETLGRNRARQVPEASFFEFGRVYARGQDGTMREDDRVALGLMGPAGRLPLQKRAEVSPQEALLWIKGVVESLCAGLGVGAPVFVPAECPGMEPGMAMEVRLADKACGHLGILNRKIGLEWRFYDPVAVAELRVDALVRDYFRVRPTTPPPVYPSTCRDIAFVIDKNIRHEDIERALRGAAPSELERVLLFDVYTGKSVEKGKKSLAYSLTYRSADRTLTDDEVNAFHAKVQQAVVDQLQAEIRDA